MMLLYILGGLVCNCIVGAGVMAAIDTDGRKFEWFKRCPDKTGFLQFIVLELWPIPLFLWWRHEYRQ